MAEKIAGYRALDENEINLINEGKELERRCKAWLSKLSLESQLDQRSIALGRTNLEQSFMWSIRGIARPE